MALAIHTALRQSRLYTKAKQCVLQHHNPSIALIQDQLRIGHAQATALFGAMLGDILDFNAATGEVRIIAVSSDQEPAPAISIEQRLAMAQTWIDEAACLVVVAGQGMDAEATVQTHVHLQGIAAIKAYQPSAPAAWLDPALTAQAFLDQPQWAFAAYRSHLAVSRAAPLHSGCAAIKQWCDGRAQGAFVYTSHVDGRFQKAGFPLSRVYESEGTIHRLQCAAHCSESREIVWSSFSVRSTAVAASNESPPESPQCPCCDAPLRPNCVLPHDRYWNPSRRNRQQTLLDGWLERSSTPLLILVGVQAHETQLQQFAAQMQARGSQCIELHVDGEDSYQGDEAALCLSINQALHHGN
ncbi:hypothetical protein [Lampropedia aestuarii]|uniref:hypothetical protein n=1 Tax=Lampropedia aestuarii TaxID=2562762 RepID=UPI002469605B|nr:hypothetical protein [Lampropedia aestuarii]MDH5859183.1 hypothetical protein [Lampropedia aestuarii]